MSRSPLPGSLDALPNNLPAQPSSFVGRRAELREVGRLLSEHRLLTLTGPGGGGKTRLALQTASENLERFPDGVWWVELAPLADGRLVGPAIAEALGVRPMPGMTELQTVGAYLASRQTLVVLDNCEHLLEACAEAAEALVDAARMSVVLATSRAPLGVSGEVVWGVPSLSLPGESTDSAGPSDAVALFMERATKARSDLVPSPDDAEALAHICTELEGLPLAIELAAARVRILSIKQIAAGLSDRFRMLSGGPGASDRLKTMRASIDWSYALLSSSERMLLRRLSVFVGGFHLEAVDEVCTDDGIEREAVLDLLASLVDQSLMIAEETDAGVRYRLLETVRQYGLERLSEAGEEEKLRGRHRDLFLALAQRAAPHLESARQREYLELLDPETANLAAAIDYALDSDPPIALDFCLALHRWWRARGRFAEAELAYSRSLASRADRDPQLRARVLERRAALVNLAGDLEAGEMYATEALALASEVGDQATAARARVAVGRALSFPNPRAGRAELERAVELARGAGDDWTLVEAQIYLAATYLFQADHAQGARANGEVAVLAGRLGDPAQMGRLWANVCHTAVFDGRLGEARRAAEQTHVAVDAAGEPVFEALADAWLGTIDVFEGKPERALERLNRRLERAVMQGAGLAVLVLSFVIALAEIALGRLTAARDRLEGMVPRVEGRWAWLSAQALEWLAETLRLQGDDAADSSARRAQTSAEECGNRLLTTQARLTLGRLAAARGEWTEARQHALAHLDACVEGGHANYIPPCLDALAEVAAGIEAPEDAARLFAAAERTRAEIGMIRLPPEAEYWTAIDAELRKVLGDHAYAAAGAQGWEMSTDDAVEWARRARGPRRRPPGGWDSLTPTELKVAELVAQGLTNPQVAERMFVSPGTVKTHLSHIYRKLEVHNRAELAARLASRDRGG